MSSLQRYKKSDGTITYILRWRENGKPRGKKVSDDYQTALRIQNEFNRRQDFEMWGLPALKTNIDWPAAKEKYLDVKKADNEAWHVAVCAIQDLEKKVPICTLKDFNKDAARKYRKICEDEGREPGGINRYLRVFSNVGTFLKVEGFTHTDPMEGMTFCKGEWINKAPFLEDDEVLIFLEKAWAKYQKFGITGLYTGFRPGEILMTDLFDDVDLSRNTIRVSEKKAYNWHPKTYQIRTIPLNPELRPYIIQWRKESKHSLIVCNDDGSPIGEKSMGSMFRRFLKPKLKIEKLIPYVFRHTFAAKYLFETKDLFGLSKILGHSSVRVTEKCYGHLKIGYHDEGVRLISFKPR
jgi:integrase